MLRIELDLVAANDVEARRAHPWVVAFGHRPMYCSNGDGDDCTKEDSKVRTSGLEALFYEGGVDLSFEAHEHSYERMFPVYNNTVHNVYNQSCVDDVGCTGQTVYASPTAPIHIVTGAAGCNENFGECINPISKHRGPWSAVYLQKGGTYSYGRLTAHNRSVLQWQVVVAEEETMVDDVIITASSHGPRSRHRTPQRPQ